jgi:outer membrane protein TolC
VQSEATVTSTTAQYQVGRVTFASVLEAITGYVADVEAFYESVAAIQRVEIAQREVSLEAADGLPPLGIGASSMPGAGGMGAGASPAAAVAQPLQTTGSGSMSRM